MSDKTNILDFTAPHGKKVSIPIYKIVGICEPTAQSKANGFNTFIATGPDDIDGGENGWYVIDTFEDVRRKLDLALD